MLYVTDIDINNDAMLQKKVHEIFLGHDYMQMRVNGPLWRLVMSLLLR